MEYLGAWGTLIHEKNLKSKISCQTPFKGIAMTNLKTTSQYLLSYTVRCTLSRQSSCTVYRCRYPGSNNNKKEQGEN
jgi:hypothetical protein